MKFKALEIGSGDAFLIETQGQQFLFDSGGSKSKICDLTKKNKVIDLAICSHNDSDHSNGFIGLLESPSVEIKEIWLPGIWIPILNFIIEEGINRDLIHIFYKNIEEHNDIKDNNNEIYDYSSLVEETDISIETFDDKLQIISEIEESQHHILTYYILYQNWYKNEFINLNRIIKIAGLAYKKGSKVRWLKPENQNPSIQNPTYNFKPLNSKEFIKIDKVLANNFFKLLYLTNENKYSMVFEYLKEDKPIITFSADSDYSFTTGLAYKNNIIVTAPHHGSESNNIVYKKIKGSEIIWIRSDRKSRKRPCQDFKDLNNKYCLACAIKNHKAEICFEFNDKSLKWVCKKGSKCNC
jgi:hypothetical protein